MGEYSQRKNEIGNIYGRLTVTAFAYVNKHRNAMWRCTCVCGSTSVVVGGDLRTGHIRSCGCLQKEAAGRIGRELLSKKGGDKHPMWNGGKIQSVQGYIKVHDREHPSTKGKRKKYVSEHVLVMEKMLGRYLRPGEVVHHCNGDKTDNRPFNLRLFKTTADHTIFHNTHKDYFQQGGKV